MIFSVVKSLLLCVLATVVNSQGCGSSSPLVGKSGPLTMTTDGVSGIVTILSDCSFQVLMFNQDSGAPQFFWWGASSSNVGSGRRIVDQQLSHDGYSSATLTFTLLDNVKWDSIGFLAIWCEQFKALIALLDLSSLSNTMTLPAGFPASMNQDPGVALATSSFENCMTLMPGVFNLHWTVFKGNSTIEFGYEYAGANITWAGFGLSDPSLPTASMINSNPTIVGAHVSAPPQSGTFVLDYFITSRVQCDFVTSQGACPSPNPTNASNTAATLNLVSAQYNSMKRTRLIRFSRSLTQTIGNKNYSYNLNMPVPAVWALGPLSEDSTRPVVLYHGAAHSAQDFKINLGAAPGMSTCGAIMSAGSTTVNTNNPRYVNNTREFTFTTGPNPNYPNPPGWGLSFYVNGVESPTLQVTRGVTYTFIVKAGDMHPLYLTSSMLGGKSGLSSSNETVFTGDAGVAKGSNEKPYQFTWTPDAKTPDSLYYQCYTHQKLGWKIQVEGKSSSAAFGKHSYSVEFLMLVALFYFAVGV
ncbi:hypothetical protein HDU78_007973 [Chytriomyces hyalinus]|nr:hypothetical protein HDU78_007973 [Chytriomyces hyalinus]